MTYKSLNDQLTGRNKDRRKIANNTYIERRADAFIAVRLHTTDILTFASDGSIALNTGGWQTTTTKARINDCLPSAFHLWSDRGLWYLANHCNADERHVYQDGITITPDGTIIGAGEPVKNLSAIKRQIKKYVTGYMDAFDAGQVPSPTNGDCWGCLMKTDDGKLPMGGPDHIKSHFEESYYVPSLLLRAIERFPISQVAKAYVGSRWAPDPAHPFADYLAKVAREQVTKALRRFVTEQLGFQG